MKIVIFEEKDYRENRRTTDKRSSSCCYKYREEVGSSKKTPSPLGNSESTKSVEKIREKGTIFAKKQDELRQKSPKVLRKWIAISGNPRWETGTFCRKLPPTQPNYSQEIMKSLRNRHHLPQQVPSAKKPFREKSHWSFKMFREKTRVRIGYFTVNLRDEAFAFCKNQQCSGDMAKGFCEHQ